MGRRLTYWVFLGVIGFVVFYMMHSSVAFNAGAPIQNNSTAIEAKTSELAKQLGFSMDSLQVMTTRTQHFNYYKRLQDSVGTELPKPVQLNRRGVNLTGWKVNIGVSQGEGEALSPEASDFLNELGRLELRYDSQGNIRRINSNPQNPNPTFVAGDSLLSIANHIVRDILDYNLENYHLNSVDVEDKDVSTEPGFEQQPLNLSDNSVGNNTVFNWSVNDTNARGAHEISLEVKQILRERNTPTMANIRYGVSIESFKAMDRYEPEQLDSSRQITNSDLIVLFGSLGVLVGLVFFMGIKHINKGQVEWRRAITVLVSVGLGVLGWRAFHLMNTMDGFLSGTSSAIYILNNLIFAGALGLYAALAYIGWEAIARSREHDQLNLLDAFWRKRFFFRETGESLLRGYALAGVILGLFAVGLYLFDTTYYQADSQYGFAEPSMKPKLLTINMAAWINVWVVALGHIGVAVGFLQSKIKNQWLFYGTGMLLIGFLLAGSALLVGIVGPVWYDIILFAVIAGVIIYATENTGLMTFSTAWWVFVVVLMIMPYWGSTSMDVAYIAWVQYFVLAVPLIYGFIAFRYGDSVSKMSGYIPEYQERMANHLRVEKEIEIARESQFKLMPLQPPSVEGVDVYGFFMPSFEVGGDYFDYIVGSNGSANSQVLNMTIADVSGKAMKAAMHAVFTSGLLLSRLHRDAPESILREITPTLHTRTDPQTFITCIVAQYNLSNKKLRIANAGHCLPILKRNGKAEFISTPAPKYPLGLLHTVNYKAMEVDLQEGDFLLFYSDGLPEAVNPEGERFGYEQLISLVESLESDDLPSNEISLEIKRRVQKFSDYQLADDTTIICLKV